MAVNIGGAVVLDGDFDAWKTGSEHTQDGREVVESDGVNGDNFECTCGRLGKVGDANLDVLKNGENISGCLVKELTLGGECDAVPKAFEQGDAKSLLEGTDLLRDSALGDLIESRSSGKSTCGNEVAKDFERLDLHGLGCLI